MGPHTLMGTDTGIQPDTQEEQTLAGEETDRKAHTLEGDQSLAPVPCLPDTKKVAVSPPFFGHPDVTQVL